MQGLLFYCTESASHTKPQTCLAIRDSVCRAFPMERSCVIPRKEAGKKKVNAEALSNVMMSGNLNLSCGPSPGVCPVSF